ncbi:MAG: hypothetical protein IBJ18_05035 [Phycisphaerales bacterium]|nr:hypothetical protein [Phycisphaerales bacterium]
MVIVHDVLGEGARADQLDAVTQARAVQAALGPLGHTFAGTVELSLDLARARREIAARRPEVVFNLVESVEGHGRLAHLGPALFEAMGVPFTGSGSGPILVSTSKRMTKAALAGAGVHLARDYGREELAALADGAPGLAGLGVREFEAGRYIVKSVWEEASVGIDDDCVVEARSAGELLEAVDRLAGRMGGEAFAERFVEGREFNMSALCSGGVGGGGRVNPRST